VNLKALIFDVDGTLADTEEAHRQAFNGAFARHGFNWEWNRDTYRELLGVTGGKERISHFIRGLRLDAARQDQCLAEVGIIHRSKTALYTHAVETGRLPLRCGVERLLREARSARVKLAIATTTSPENVRALVAATLGEGALDWFDAVVCGDAVPKKKPAPDAYHRVLEILALPAQCCVAFEDSRNGLRAALGARLRTVVTPCQWTAGQDFSDAWLELPYLGDPERPLPPDLTERLGMPWLTLDVLSRVRDAA
jgi:HAD superfamily hydrolase (TIGR01509 family)